MRRVLLVSCAVLVGYGAWSHWHQRAVVPGPGVLAPQVPQQVDIDNGVTLQRGDTTLTTRARFELTARVLSRADYNWGDDAKLIPVDLALGWGRMSDSDVLAHIAITQSGRYYHWRVEQFPIPRREIETSSANMHLIPADDDVRRELQRVRQGEVVHLAGFLVDASRPGNWHWKTSMTRNDTGGGACELIYVESLSRAAP